MKEVLLRINKRRVRLVTNARKGEKRTPLVLIHGWNSSAETWFQLAEKLKEFYWLIIPDLPGFGHSEDISGHSIKDYTFWLGELLTTIDPRIQFNLIGHSYGSNIVVRSGWFFPEKVKTTISINPGIMEVDCIRFGELWMARKLVLSLVGEKERIRKLIETNRLSTIPRLPEFVKKEVNFVKYPNSSTEAFIEVLLSAVNEGFIKEWKKRTNGSFLVFSKNDFSFRNLKPSFQKRISAEAFLIKGGHTTKSLDLNSLEKIIKKIIDPTPSYFTESKVGLDLRVLDNKKHKALERSSGYL